MSTDRKCVVCEQDAVLLVSGDREATADALERALGRTGVRDVMKNVPDLYRCRDCGLEFAMPMSEPGSAFYEWLTRSGFDYPVWRWEWEACRKLLGDDTPLAQGTRVLLDVGCGDGRFLSSLRGVQGLRTIGVDHNRDAVQEARRHGHEVVLGGFNEVQSLLTDGVDAITFWHVVEHVNDPVGLLQQAQGLLREGGRLFFSVPLTPMSYEHAWTDPFNAPPHHLTRWNLRALEVLAMRLDMQLHMELPTAERLVKRVARSLALQAMPTFGTHGRWRKATRLASFLARRPWRLPQEIWQQMHRTRHAGRTLPDVALVVLENRVTPTWVPT
ncbi:class I SAM-dependent methyltransferase [Luteimonas suaedae]|uniref:class I SAM-dependent methyltransferase n=1 Tax=Luteimonas suaedae TaxID=2605430 RepID=UPI0011EBF02F|nr:class I SAM-dependent methyltransferase [Luteimonas suaedae]